ncbi:MAG: sodium:solute symporter family protein [Nanoarchaeota archaeon]
MVNSIVIISILAYILVLVLITLKSSKKESEAEFISGNNKVSTLGTMASQFIGSIDGSGLVVLTILAAAMGFGLYWIVIGFAIAFLILALQSTRIKKLSKNLNCLTQNDLLEKQIGTKSSKIVSLIIVLTGLIAVAGLIHVSGTMASSIFGINSNIGIVLVSLIVGGYIYFGGYSAIVKTDIFQMITVIILLATVLFIGELPKIETFSTFWLDGTLRTLIGTAFFGFFLMYGLPDLWQRIFTSKSAKTAIKANASVPFIYAVTYFLIIVLATTLFTNFAELDPSSIIFALLNGNISPFFGSILSVTMIALIMSTLDSRLYIVLSTITSNWFKIDKENNSKTYKSMIQKLTVLSFIIMALIAILISDFVQFALNLYSFLMLIGPIMFFSLYVKRTKFVDFGMLVSLIIGAIVYVYMFINGGFIDFFANVIPVMITFICAFIVFGIDKLILGSKNSN